MPVSVCVQAHCLPSNGASGCHAPSTISHCDELGAVSITHLNCVFFSLLSRQFGKSSFSLALPLSPGNNHKQSFLDLNHSVRKLHASSNNCIAPTNNIRIFTTFQITLNQIDYLFSKKQCVKLKDLRLQNAPCHAFCTRLATKVRCLHAC